MWEKLNGWGKVALSVAPALVVVALVWNFAGAWFVATVTPVVTTGVGALAAAVPVVVTVVGLLAALGVGAIVLAVAWQVIDALVAGAKKVAK